MNKLVRVRQGRVISGVCGGVARYLNVDPTVVRVIWAIACCLGFAGVLAYILCVLIIPEEDGFIIDS